MRKVISMSVFGNLYYHALAVENIRIAMKHLADWELSVWVPEGEDLDLFQRVLDNEGLAETDRFKINVVTGCDLATPATKVSYRYRALREMPDVLFVIDSDSQQILSPDMRTEIEAFGNGEYDDLFFWASNFRSDWNRINAGCVGFRLCGMNDLQRDLLDLMNTGHIKQSYGHDEAILSSVMNSDLMRPVMAKSLFLKTVNSGFCFDTVGRTKLLSRTHNTLEAWFRIQKPFESRALVSLPDGSMRYHWRNGAVVSLEKPDRKKTYNPDNTLQ